MFNIFQTRAKRGFTLAEVLITLGIIGIVAAMTIPGLITKYQNMLRLPS
jgi:prepilin-type N-terminal cleavage/methylation domain-containing protein